MKSPTAMTANAVATAVLDNNSGTMSSLPCQNCGDTNHSTEMHQKFKTKLCKYNTNGHCNLTSDRCPYAHGDSELRGGGTDHKPSRTVRVVAAPPDDANNKDDEPTSASAQPVSIQTAAANAAMVNGEAGNTPNTAGPIGPTLTNGAIKPSSVHYNNRIKHKSHHTSSATNSDKHDEKDDKQCNFVSRGQCDYARKGETCPFKHGFCSLYCNSNAKCSRPNCKWIHHRHQKALVKMFEDLCSSGQLKDSLCQACHKNTRWNFSRYCLNCSQRPENKKEFCSHCDNYIWGTSCQFCYDRIRNANNNNHG